MLEQENQYGDTRERNRVVVRAGVVERGDDDLLGEYPGDEERDSRQRQVTDDDEPDQRERLPSPRLARARRPEQIPLDQEEDAGEEQRAHGARQAPALILLGRENLQLAERVLVDLVAGADDRLAALDLIVDGVDVGASLDALALGTGEIERQRRLDEPGTDVGQAAALGLPQVGNARHLHHEELSRFFRRKDVGEVSSYLRRFADRFTPADGAPRREEPFFARDDVARQDTRDGAREHLLDVGRELLGEQEVELIVSQGYFEPVLERGEELLTRQHERSGLVVFVGSLFLGAERLTTEVERGRDAVARVRHRGVVEHKDLEHRLRRLLAARCGRVLVLVTEVVRRPHRDRRNVTELELLDPEVEAGREERRQTNAEKDDPRPYRCVREVEQIPHAHRSGTAARLFLLRFGRALVVCRYGHRFRTLRQLRPGEFCSRPFGHARDHTPG